MDNQQFQYKRCRRCGSYMPSEWYSCGRCGYSHFKKPVRAKWVLVLVILALFGAGYLYKDKLLAFLPYDIEKPNHFISISSLPPPIQSVETSSSAEHILLPASSVAPQPIPVDGRSVSEEDFYNKIHVALREGAASVKLPYLAEGYDSKLLFDIIRKVVLDDPMVLFYEGCTFRSDGLLIFKYNKDETFRKKASKELELKVQAILQKVIKPGMSDFDKELAIHDFLINNCRYDQEGLAKDAIPSESHTAYGALVLKTAVCEGYAKAVKLLLDNTGIESVIVVGTSKNVSHAWNLVKIQGSYYHLDATWDDPIMEGGGQTLQYSYFNLQDKEIQKDHTWESSDYPSASSAQYSYYVYQGLMVDSSDALVDMMVTSVKNGKSNLSLRIANYIPNSLPIADLIEEVAAAVNCRSISYSINEDFGVVDVWFK